MNSRTETFMHLVIAVVIMLVLSVATYFIGCKIAPSILDDAQKAGVKVLALSDWKVYYFYLVLYMGIIAELILLFWTALSHWSLHTSDSSGVGKRGLWVVLGIILATLCVAVPEFYHREYYQMTIDMSIQVLFFVCYCLVGYWGGSILVTSDRYKYTPLLASFLRA